MPEWGKAADGRSVRLSPDPSLEADYAEWKSKACEHRNQFTGKTVNAGGVDVYKRYCRGCGIATTQSLPYRTIEGTTVSVIDPEKRDALVDDYINDRRDQLEDIANRAANRTQPAARAEYGHYLSSPEWQERRRAVLERCAGLCEGCRKQPARDVHHLSYQHIRAEFLFELVGLCRDCHDRWHGKDV
ncbi:hypothetical protein D9602_05815 [Sphingomonas sp. TX0522]|nr:hypothetical protein [Sphingomonas sp. TX0522]